jgi:Ner family transcriptional regulator
MKNDDQQDVIYRKEEITWAWIKLQLATRDSSFAKLAKLNKVARQNIAIAKHSPYPKYERLIAEEIGLHASDIWPHRYDPALTHNNKSNSHYKDRADYPKSNFKRNRKYHTAQSKDPRDGEENAKF